VRWWPRLVSAVQCSAVQCSAVQCSAVQCSAVQCSAVQQRGLPFQFVPGAESVRSRTRTAPQDDQLKQLSSVTTTIGVALFLLLSFRNNAAFTRWQNGSDK